TVHRATVRLDLTRELGDGEISRIVQPPEEGLAQGVGLVDDLGHVVGVTLERAVLPRVQATLRAQDEQDHDDQAHTESEPSPHQHLPPVFLPTDSASAPAGAASTPGPGGAARRRLVGTGPAEVAHVAVTPRPGGPG